MSSCLLFTMSSEAPHLPDELPPIGGQFRGYARFLNCMMTPKMMSRLGNHTIFSALTSWAWFSSALAHVLIFMLIHSSQFLDNWVQMRTSVNLTASLERAQVTTTAEWWKNQASIAKRQQKFNFVMQQPTSTMGNHIASLYPSWLNIYNWATSFWDILSLQRIARISSHAFRSLIPWREIPGGSLVAVP